MECRRLEEFASGTSWHRSLYTAILSERLDDRRHLDAQPERDVRTRRALCGAAGPQLMISAGGPLPSNVGVIQALFYEPIRSGA